MRLKSKISKKLALIFGTPIFITLILVWIFYEKHLSGVWPAIQKPEQDIVELIKKAELTEKAPEPTPIEKKFDIIREKKVKKSSSPPPLRIPGGGDFYFPISVFAEDLDTVRDLELGPDGVLLASIMSQGKVVALPDQNGDGVSDKTVVVAKELNNPHGLASRCDEAGCKLYIAESDQVAVYDYDKENLKAANKKKLTDLPDSGRHYTRSILFRPPPHDDELFVSIGSSCNTCHEENEQQAAIWTLNVETGEFKSFAKGLRNSVFMALHPKTGQLWATDMGRDLLGDDLPPDEINIVEQDKNYGWPICYGKNIHDTDFDKNTYIRNPCMEPFETQSYIDIPAHSSPLGLAFIPDVWPEEYRNGLLVAYHGSWNRSEPTGYKIEHFQFNEAGQLIRKRPFIWGWLTKEGKSLGRPVDLLIKPDGTLFVSDDKAGVVYRIPYMEYEEGKKLFYDYYLKSVDESDVIQVDSPKPNQMISSSETLLIKGKALPGKLVEIYYQMLWATVYDEDGNAITSGEGVFPGERSSLDDGAFKDFLFEVPFLKDAPPATKEGKIVLSFHPTPNADYSYHFYMPIQFDMSTPPADTGGTCVANGCTQPLCTPKKVSQCDVLMDNVITCCEEHKICERQDDGTCGWTELEEYKNCVFRCDY